MPLTVRPISREEHLALRRRAALGVSFLQCPSWAAVKSGVARREPGLVRPAGALVGAGLVLYRQVPKVKRFLAYLPEGPVIDWAGPTSTAGSPRWSPT